VGVTALDVALAGVAGTFLSPLLGGWIERRGARHRQQLDRQLARDNLNFSEKKLVYTDVLVHAQRLSTSARRLHVWSEVGGEPPDLLDLPEDEEQAILTGRLAAFASDEVTTRTQTYWSASFAYLSTGPALHEALQNGDAEVVLDSLRNAELSALDALHKAGVALRNAIRADLAEP
jgi:hypothetical protein